METRAAQAYRWAQTYSLILFGVHGTLWINGKRGGKHMIDVGNVTLSLIELVRRAQRNLWNIDEAVHTDGSTVSIPKHVWRQQILSVASLNGRRPC
jgi:hypothetical protein